MNIIRKYIQKHRERYEATKESLIKNEFKVMEKGGSLWLTHDGRAFARINDDVTAECVAELVKNARWSAVAYEKL